MQRTGSEYDNVGDTLDHCMAEGMEYRQPEYHGATDPTFSNEMKSWVSFGKSLSWRWRVAWAIATPVFISLQVQRFAALRFQFQQRQ